MVKWIKSLFDKKSFSSKGGRLEFKGGGRQSFIYYRQPTGEEVLNYSYAALDTEKSELKKLSGEKVDAEKLHKITRQKKFIPFAKDVIEKIEGYEKNTVEFVEKWFPHHLESVAIYAYAVDDKCKKKQL